MANQQAKPQEDPAYDPAEAQGTEPRDDTPPEGAEPDPVAALEAERDAMRDRLMRALADAENTRKRAEKDRRDAALYGGSKLTRDMLPVYDNLARALNSASDEARTAAPGLVQGIELTLRELTNILEKHGVTRICPEPGDAFDPHHHQAMFEAPVPDYKAGQIIQVMAEGFKLHDQLLRPAQVGVSSTPAG
ncbi:nucleotide exchange factor GrpE [Rhodobacteraceae bacterium 2376]|uniref:Protein GrpE n=1 Tax=Rhabdonatronobacter sediminivivens TaxID=2743469 RepID=A0A7Z0HZL7_9RHOB|nr:nucleotide exchange factor GrpE [Rhabdonatronobacter sediminivivens]NYS25216.1 nucleotide exchange factor GrpE [Rhabdonatronobacter sediminivivens]